jgi:hypothetical protein
LYALFFAALFERNVSGLKTAELFASLHRVSSRQMAHYGFHEVTLRVELEQLSDARCKYLGGKRKGAEKG